MKTKSIFDFYEVIEITDSEYSCNLNGMSGVVLGMSVNDDDEWNYSIHIFEMGEVWCMSEKQLLKTGKMMSKEDIYDGTSVSVKMNNVVALNPEKGPQIPLKDK